MRRVWSRLPWWGRLLIILGMVAGVIVYWKVVLGLFVALLVLVVGFKGLMGSRSYRRGFIGSGTSSGLYTPRINKKGVEFITGRKWK